MAAASPSVGRSSSFSSSTSSSYHPGLQKKSQEVPIPKFHLVVETEEVESMERSAVEEEEEEEEELLDDALFEKRHEQHLAEMHRQYEVVREEQERLKRTRVLARQGGGKFMFLPLFFFVFFFYWLLNQILFIYILSNITYISTFCINFFLFGLFFFFFLQQARRIQEEMVEGVRLEEVQGLVDQGEQVPHQEVLVLVLAGVASPLPRRYRAAVGVEVAVEVGVVSCV